MHEAKVGLADKIAARSSAEVKTYVTDNGKGGQSLSTRRSTKLAKSGFKNIDVSDYVVEHRMVIMDGMFYRTFIQMSIDPTNRNVVTNTFNSSDNETAKKAMENF